MLHIIQNDPEVPLGNLAEHLTVPYQLHHLYKNGQLPSLEDISGLIVLGGAMGANDDAKHPFLSGLKRLIRDVVVAGKPYLGICLGGQLLAAALGAAVVSNRWEELGTLSITLAEQAASDPLFKGISSSFSTFQWHHDSFNLPDGAVLLASSAACPHQAFRVGHNAWGLQFHPEVTDQIICDWCAWDIATQEKTEVILTEFISQRAAYSQTAMQLTKNFIAWLT